MLTVADLAFHAALGIDAALLERAGVERVSDREARELLSMNGRHGEMSGIVYPYLDPDTGRPTTRRLRRDHPEIEGGKPKDKYLSAFGDAKHLYFPPDAAPLLADTSVLVVEVEAEKSALALTAAATRAGRRVLVIGTGGCWGWRGRIGKTIDPNGARVDETGPVPDLARITWTGRDTVILFDANAASNPKVQAARLALARELAGRGAHVRIGELPEAEGVNGPDDFVGRYGDAALWLVIDRARPSRVRVKPPEADDSRRTVGVSLDDFHSYMPTHAYIFAPTAELWPGSSVNTRIPVVSDGKRKVPATTWLDQHRAVEQMTWIPGHPRLLHDQLVSEGGWILRPGCTTFNLYRPPIESQGDGSKASPWIEHVYRVYPQDAEHLLAWLAHRVQRPAEKVNHGVVLGGLQGIGKDSLLEPVKAAVGPWNFVEVSPTHLLGRFNGFAKSVILRVSEARDLGDVDRYSFYDHLKVYMAAPPDVLRVDEKHLREHAVWNVCGVVITTNHKIGGLYLPADDRRHFVAWSDLSKDDFQPGYWTRLYRWFNEGGRAHVAAFLREYDLTGFDPKAPPPKTAAFWDLVDADRAPEDAELADVLDRLGNPSVVTLQDLAGPFSTGLSEWLKDRKNQRQVPHRMQSAGYVPVRNDCARDGLWKIDGRRQVVYGRHDLSLRDRLAAARELGGGQ